MADVPESPDHKTKTAVTQPIRDHVKRGWPHLGDPVVSFRGQFCYVAARLSRRSQPSPILRLRYQGSADRWGIGIYRSSSESYTESELPPRSDRRPAPRNRASTTPSSSTAAPADTPDPVGHQEHRHAPTRETAKHEDRQEAFKARTRKMTPAQGQAACGRLEVFINALIEASISVLTDEELRAYNRSAGLDATSVPLLSRGPSQRTGLCASDPDGGWYVREGDPSDHPDDTGQPLRKIAWALEATIATMARPPGAPPACPNLAIGLAMARPGEDPGPGARVLTSAAARGRKPGPLGFDRAYTQALPEHFHLPARALGYQPVMDYRADQPGIQADAGGAILAEGTWSARPCPAR